MVAAIARRQFGVLSVEQLRAVGLTPPAISRRARDGRLVRLHLGVYAIGHRELRPQAFWLAAVLAGGAGAVVSHRSAAAAWELTRTNPAVVEVTIPGERGRRQTGIAAHQCRLSPADVTTLDGIPITTPARTLLDLAEVVPRNDLDRAVEEALRLRRCSTHALRRQLDRSNGRRGTGPLRACLGALDPLVPFANSELERRMLPLIRRHGLPEPLVNVRVAGLEVDLLWPAHRLVVELDGYAFHHTRGAFERDRARDARLQQRGYVVQRFSYRQVTEQPGVVAGTIAALLAGPRATDA